MTLLTRYLFRDLIRPVAVSLAVLLGLVWLMQSLRFVDLMINKGLSAGTFFNLTAFLIPQLVFILLPLAFFAGCVFALRRWHDESELIALYNAGLSRLQAGAALLLAAMAAVAVGLVTSLYLMPAGMQAFKTLQYDIRHSEGHLLLEEGTFNALGDNLMVYLKRRVGLSGLDTLLVHDTRNPEAPITWMAQRGNLTTTAEGFPRLTLQNGIRQEVSADVISMLEFKEHTLDVSSQMDVVPVERFRDAEERTLAELLRPQDDAVLTPRQRQQFVAEAWRRLMWPVLPLPLALLALAWLMPATKHRGGQLREALYAAGCALAVLAAMMVLQSLLSRGAVVALYAQGAMLAAVCVCSLAVIGKRRLR